MANSWFNCDLSQHNFHLMPIFIFPTDKQSYNDFLKKNREAYDKISAGFETLYGSEEKIGSFNPDHYLPIP